MELLDELHKAGSTICMVTHDPRYAVADRKIFMFDGRVVDENDAPPAQGKRTRASSASPTPPTEA
jgi:ABC-type lipoprotein export system ATPase subunit